jgi:NAD(P)-dependent dehydrogenase (short-subunit alcohol dehydrogenase family)
VLPPNERLRVLALDVTDAESIRQAVNAAGQINVLINNARISALAALEGNSIETARDIPETNTLGTIAMTQAVLPQFRQRKAGDIVNVTSGSMPLHSVYTASKAAVNTFPESLALELHQFSICVNLALQGQVESRFGESARPRIQDGIPDAYAASRSVSSRDGPSRLCSAGRRLRRKRCGAPRTIPRARFASPLALTPWR